MRKEGIVIAPKIDSSDTYYLFRQNGRELSFKITNNAIADSRELTTLEREYITKNCLIKQHSLLDKLKDVPKDVLDKLELRLQVLQNQ